MRESSIPAPGDGGPAFRSTGIVILGELRVARTADVGSTAEEACRRRRLSSALERVNADPDRLLARFGASEDPDGFAGVVRTGHVGSVLWELWEAFHPVEVVSAAVQGTVEVRASAEVASEAARGDAPVPGEGFDGPARERAVARLEQLRDRRPVVRLLTLEIAGGRTDRLLTALGDLLYARVLAWTDRQLEVVRAFRRAPSQMAAAEELGIRQSTVSRALRGAESARVEPVRETFVEVLDRVSREAVS